MPSTYTLNNGIELIGTGEQSGTWGDTTNTNLELLDTALDGQVTVTLASAGTSGSPNTLAISDGAASDGRNRMVIFDDSSDLGATAYVQLTPNDSEKIIYVRNSLSGSRDIILFQGTYSASNDYVVPAGKTAVIFFDGGGAGAVAANVFNNAHFDSLNIVGTSTFGDDVTFTGANYNVVWDKSADTLNFADNAKATFGTSNDLELYHNGTHNIIQANVGNITLETTATDADIFIKSDDGSGGSATYLQADGSTGSINLRHYGTIALETTTNGVTVTGASNITPDAGFNSQLKVAASGYSGGLSFDGDGMWVGHNSASRDLYFAINSIERMVLTSGGSVNLRDTLANNHIVLYSDGGAVFNNQGGSTPTSDFRIEGDSITSMFYVDASENEIGIGTNDPNAMLGIEMISGATPLRLINSTADADVYIRLQGKSGVSNYYGDIVFNATGATETLYFKPRYNGNALLSLSNSTSGAVFNEAGENRDFRVESDTRPYMLFVDASADRVGINSGDTPASTLDIRDATDGTIVRVRGDGTKGGGRTIQLGVGNETYTDFGNFQTYMLTTASDSASSGLAIASVGGTNTDSGVQIWTSQQSTALRERFRVDRSGNAVFNEQGYNSGALRVETDTNDYAFFVDYSNNTVTIGTDTVHSDVPLTVDLEGSSLKARIGTLVSQNNGIDSLFRFQTIQSNGTTNVYADIGIDADQNAIIFKDPGASSGTIGQKPVYIRHTGAVEATAGATFNAGGGGDVEDDFNVGTDNYTGALEIDASADNILFNVNTVQSGAMYGGNTGYATFKINASGSAGSGETWITSNRLRYSESTNQFQRSSATEKASMILLDEDANIKFYTQPSTTQTGTYSLAAKATLHADGHFNALGVGYGVQGAETDTTNLLAGKITSASSVSYDFVLDSSTGDWSGGYFLIKAQTINSSASGDGSAWWLYDFGHYNGSLNYVTNSDSGGNTGNFTITISDQGGTDPITLRVNIAHSNNRLVTSVECGNYYGVRSVS